MAKSSAARKAQASNLEPSDHSPQSAAAKDKKRPVHVIRYRGCEAAIWKNDSDDRDYYSVTVRKSWRDEKREWHDASTFLASDLPLLAKAISDAHSWIAGQEQQQRAKAGKGGGS